MHGKNEMDTDFNPPASNAVSASSGRFQSTRPLRGGTGFLLTTKLFCGISIHPPLAGRDWYQHRTVCCIVNFNPPAPCVAGLSPPRVLLLLLHFNPPAPCVAGPPKYHDKPKKGEFQSTRPLRGGTRIRRTRADADEFQSTRPLRGGTLFHPYKLFPFHISIHPPLAGRDPIIIVIVCAVLISIHPPLAGRDFKRRRPPAPPPHFNPPAPCGAGQRSCTKKLCKTSHIAQKVHLPWPY